MKITPNTEDQVRLFFEELLRQDDNSLAIFPDAVFKEILLTGSWYLWWLRRQVTHNESIPPVERWSTSVLAIANHYKKSTAKNSSNVDERWTLPNSGFVKVNVDAAFHADCGSGATAAVIRDFKGNFIAANCAYIDRGLNVVSMEAMAMRDGLNLANSLGFHNVEAESDSTQVISSCSGQSQWWDEAAAIFADCVDLAASIGRVKFKHCSRTTNEVAHEIAKYSFCNRSSESWINEPPGWLINTLVHDVTVIV